MKNRYFIFGLLIIAITVGILGILFANNLPPFGQWRPHKTTNEVSADKDPNDADLVICAPKWERGVTSHVHLGPFPFALSTHYSSRNLGDQDCLSIRKDSDGNILGNKNIVQLNAFLAAHNKLFITRSTDGYYINIVD